MSAPQPLRFLDILPSFFIIVSSLIIVYAHSSPPQKVDLDSSSKQIYSWKTFNEYGVSFNYPSDWLEQSPEFFGSRVEVGFKFKQGYPLYFTTQGNYNQITGKPFTSLDEYLESRNVTASDLTVNDYPAKLFKIPGDGHTLPATELVAFSQDKRSIVSLYFQPDYSKTPVTFSLLLPTFKFANKTD